MLIDKSVFKTSIIQINILVESMLSIFFNSIIIDEKMVLLIYKLKKQNK